MRFKDLMHETFSALAANKGRTFLTILGIVIGIAAVIAMTSLIGGIKQGLINELGLEQSRMITIYYGSEGAVTTMSDIEGIEENVAGYEFITGSQMNYDKVTTGTKSCDSQIVGIGPGYFRTSSAQLIEGRLFTDGELEGESMNVVIDTTLKRELFGENETCVGKTIQMRNDDYEVIGVVENTGILAGSGVACIPLNTSATRIAGNYELSQISGFAAEDADIEDVCARTEQYLRKTYHIDDDFGYVSVTSMQSIQKELDSMMAAFQTLMTAVASISLLVGGIGIMNMMLTNVTERIREIGLRKALGARSRDITLQFLCESVAVCLVGGIIGFALGFGAACALAGVTVVAESMGMTGVAIQPVVAPDTVAMAIGICVLIGLVFGIGPARRAAKLDPVESLRFQ